ncbi:MAG: hypothetical protein ACLP59_03915 [Bryobacteraceae bacterium]
MKIESNNLFFRWASKLRIVAGECFRVAAKHRRGKAPLPDRRILFLVFAVTALGYLAVLRGVAAGSAGTKVTYGLNGWFASAPISGDDPLGLAGQYFVANTIAYTGLVPISHGRNWGIYAPLQDSGLLYPGGQSTPISSTSAGIDQTVGGSEDIIQIGLPITLLGQSITIRANIILPGGTLSSPYIQGFDSVSLGPTSTVTYSNGADSTVLAIADGSIVAHLRTR